MANDVSELRALARDLGKVSAGTARAMYDVVDEGATDLRDEWRRNAAATSGTHAKDYPRSITSDMLVGLSIRAEVGPDPRLKQGFLGQILEYGGTHSPPHLDGQRAADTIVPRIERRIDAALGHLLGEAGL